MSLGKTAQTMVENPDHAAMLLLHIFSPINCFPKPSFLLAHVAAQAPPAVAVAALWL